MEHISKQKMAWQKDELAAMHHEEHVAAFVASGRLHSPTKHRFLLIMLVLFALLISIPAICQAVLEIRSADGIQSLHLFKDTFKTPNERAGKIRSNLDVAIANLEKGKWQDSSSVAWDGLSQSVVAASQAFINVNRHISMDTLDPQFAPWKRLRDLSLSMVDAPDVDSIAELLKGLRLLRESQDAKPGIGASMKRMSIAFVRYTVFSREYLRAWEKATEDASTLAQTTRPMLQQARFKLFDDLGIKAVRGEDDWVFYRPGVEYAVRPWVTDVRSRIVDPNDKPLTDDPIQEIVTFRDQLAKWNVELVVVPVPDKETIYPDYLTRRISADASGKVGYGASIIDSLKAKGISIINLYEAFAQDRKLDKSKQDALYLRDDTHWQLRGLQRMSKLVASEIRSRAWFMDSRRDSVSYEERRCMVDRNGDILAMSKLPAAWFAVERVPCAQVYSFERDSSGVIIDSTLYKDDFRKSRILILGDSFSRIYQTDAPIGAGWIAHLAKELGEPVASLVSDGGASTLVREKLARKPGVLKGKKLLVWEFVERDYRFGDGGWKNIELQSK